MNKKESVYYPCDICGWDAPSNKQIKVGGIETSYCMLHYRRKVVDENTTKRLVKGQQEFKEEFNKAFVNVNVDGMENN